jgi:NADPH-dependent 2,4-dienoyl-CoA reductase/sulfur reductase-like enzyme/rhodanese-related sulfurtransferase
MQKVLVIGAVAAGLKAASKLRRSDAAAEITVIDKGQYISYGACGMPYFVAGDVDDYKALLSTPTGVERTPAYFESVKNIKVLPGKLATAINRKEKSVTAQDVASGDIATMNYDKLVIATGATPVKPPIPGIELGNVFSMWHLEDAMAIRKLAERGKVEKAVIIGGGLVGMEMAEALKMWDVDVTVVEMQSHIFTAFLDDEVASAVEKYVREAGITLLTAEKVVEFQGMETVSQVRTDKRTISVDLVIMAVGAKPNAQLAKDAGLEIGQTGGIVVNDRLQTSDPDIYAGGDCVENVHIITGQKVFTPMGSVANKHGRVIGENLADGCSTFRGVLGTVIVKVLDWNVGKVGLTEKEAKKHGYNYVAATVAGYDKPHYYPDSTLMSVKLIVDIDTGKVLGAQAYGGGDVSKRIDIFATTMTMGGTVHDMVDIDLSYAPPFNNPIDIAVMAGHSILNKLSDRLIGINPIEAFKKLNDQNVVFLDVRSPKECEQVKLTECNNMCYLPLDQLRSKVGELNKNKEIIAFCKISLRGYEASGILKGCGFENVKVLEGGIYAWPY